ncbi:MAG TPA: hypothetical protein VEV85_23040 [Bryobacteraceae bacterium]|nr:hypothetical protein [Bryobacteraceae bacterium]
MVEIKCNSCGSVVDTVPIDRARPEIDGTCIHEDIFTVIKAFICQECGEGVDVEWPVQ